jgi:hypothetical protein
VNTDYSELLYKIGFDVGKELKTAIETHGLFASAHHGYAIILEELDELWDEIKKKKSIRDQENMRAEAVQVAAMAMKFIVSMEKWKTDDPVTKKAPKPKQMTKEEEEKEKQNDAKCRQCKYAVLTEDEIDKLGEDPCESCLDLSKWKPKEVPV